MKWNAAELIRQSNLYARHALLYQSKASADYNSVESGWQPPPLLAKTVGMMGLKGQPGLHIVKELPSKEGSRPSGGDSNPKRQRTDNGSSRGGGQGGRESSGRGRGRGGGGARGR